jgi:Na+-transporting methylmalonyl-CoA/oxaloacetate decarboxylase gamma subunit
MKKKIALALSLVMMTLVLGACGTDPTTVDYNGYSSDDLYSDLYECYYMVSGVASIYEQAGYSYATVPSDVTTTLMSSYGVTDEEMAAADNWLSITEEFGDFDSVDEDSFTVTKSGSTLTTDITMKFAKKDIDFQVVYEYYSMEITGITIEPIYTLGEKMQKAGLNTLISISIVFCVLILISLLIYGFNVFPYLEKKKAEKKAASAQAIWDSIPVDDQVVNQIAQREAQQQTDDTELVAVIAAAIAASTGTSTSDFVVRSINRR